MSFNDMEDLSRVYPVHLSFCVCKLLVSGRDHAFMMNVYNLFGVLFSGYGLGLFYVPRVQLVTQLFLSY